MQAVNEFCTKVNCAEVGIKLSLIGEDCLLSQPLNYLKRILLYEVSFLHSATIKRYFTLIACYLHQLTKHT